MLMVLFFSNDPYRKQGSSIRGLVLYFLWATLYGAKQTNSPLFCFLEFANVLHHPIKLWALVFDIVRELRFSFSSGYYGEPTVTHVRTVVRLHSRQYIAQNGLKHSTTI